MAGRPNKQLPLTIEQIEVVLKKNAGLTAPTAKALNVSYQAIDQRIKKSQRLQNVRENIRQKVGDMAESGLFKNINNGNMTAIIFYLKTQCQDRGYIERKELQGSIHLTHDDWVKKLNEPEK